MSGKNQDGEQASEVTVLVKIKKNMVVRRTVTNGLDAFWDTTSYE